MRGSERVEGLVMRIIVIGAGVMGASVAYRAAVAGASVTVLEAGRIGGGTSGISFAWTNSNGKTPRAYHDLNVAGMKAHAALAEEFGAAPWWHGGGSVEWVAPEERPEQQARVERLQAWGYAAEWITPQQLLELEPDVDPALIGDAPIAWFPGEGWLDPVVYAAAMLGFARSRGASVICGARVSDAVLRGGRVTGVKIADGRLFEADMVVNCAGRWANDPVSDAGLHLPLAPTVGFLVFTPPVAARVGRVVRSPIIHARPDGAARLVLHWNPTDAAVAFEPRPSAATPEARDLVQRARRLLPWIGDVEPEAVRMAIRPIPGDSFSAVGPVPRVEGYYLAITHSGVTMSPHLGAAVADEVVHGRQCPGLDNFRPARFFN
jgi:glycine/D-amino acid oxidase-like deaminating enzyme